MRIKADRKLRASRDFMKTTTALAAVALVSSCVVPKTISVYDAECGVEQKRLVLGMFDGALAPTSCGGSECAAQAATQVAVLAASTVVSGSIVVAGNIVYWLQKKKNCRVKQVLPETVPTET